MPTALISGITGQDGSYLAELLLKKGYEVHGIARRSSVDNTERVPGGVDLHYGDLSDTGSIKRLLDMVQPDEVYNLGAMSHVKVSFDVPEYTGDVTGLGTVRFLEALRGSKARFYQASSSEMFGSSPPPQNENTPFHPRSPYGCAKVFSYHSVVNYREAYGLHASNGILFNHESPRRGVEFVTRKITRGIRDILRGDSRELLLGNLDARRDWGYAKDYVEAMWRMLQQPKGDDFVVATGEMHSVREFLEEAFSIVGLPWLRYVRTSPLFHRPTEVDALQGDFSKAQRVLGWKPTTTFRELVKLMVSAEL